MCNWRKVIFFLFSRTFPFFPFALSFTNAIAYMRIHLGHLRWINSLDEYSTITNSLDFYSLAVSVLLFFYYLTGKPSLPCQFDIFLQQPLACFIFSLSFIRSLSLPFYDLYCYIGHFEFQVGLPPLLASLCFTLYLTQ